MTQMSTGVPAQKVVGSTIGAAMASLIVGLFHDHIPDHLEMSLTVIITFIFGYFTPPSANDVVKVADANG